VRASPAFGSPGVVFASRGVGLVLWPAESCWIHPARGQEFVCVAGERCIPFLTLGAVDRAAFSSGLARSGSDTAHRDVGVRRNGLGYVYDLCGAVLDIAATETVRVSYRTNTAGTVRILKFDGRELHRCTVTSKK
jgi:hypothetical protein